MRVHKALGRAAMLVLMASGAAVAQVPDISGQWRKTGPWGNEHIVLRQDGSKIVGTYHLGKLDGIFNGKVLTGSFSDIVSSGQIQLRFSDDGNQFEGEAQTSAGMEERWMGVRVGTLETTPEGILRTRARLDEVQVSGDPYEAQAVKACKNLLVATYVGRNDTWTTAQVVEPNRFTPVLGAPTSTVTVYVQVQQVKAGPARASALTPADKLNGWQYKGTVNFVGTVYRAWSGGTWQPWQDLGGRAFLFCTYIVKGGVATIQATDGLTGVSIERLTRPTSIPDE